MTCKNATLLFLLAALATACGPTVGEAVRPNDPTFAGARGGNAECHQVEAEGTPLIVDWSPEERSDLEVAMKQGVAVVHYDCNSIKLLQDCHVEGGYNFLGVTKKEQVISIENADQAQANLPLHGVKIGGEIKRGSALNIGLIMIGKKATTFDGLDRASLRGKCDGATHFVHSANVGAFAMTTATVGSVKAAVDVWRGIGASGSSESSKNVTNKDGEVDACKSADVDGVKPPNGCGAALRIRLLAVTDTVAPPSKDEPKEVTCPQGLVPTQGKCAPPAAGVPHDCTLTDTPAESEKQCNAGNASCCANASLAYMLGLDAPQDDAKASQFASKGCDLGDMQACWSYGVDLKRSNRPKAIELMTRACNAGVRSACVDVAGLYEARYESNVAKDLARAVKYYMRGCYAGVSYACGDAGEILLKGAPDVPADPARASRLLVSSCTSQYSSANHCYQAGLVFEQGNGVPADANRAKSYYKRACKSAGGYPMACDRLKKLGGS
jgi:hypothetical protein